ncbi:ABC transporter ATP-binding protein [Salibacterium aidingense]|uniref:ABC transporter ATP-binding protein n=1 Tax=Salibacterium aidingense TaxID=384933 RepID=UPI003BE5D895
MEAPLLSINNLKVYFSGEGDDIKAVDGIDFDISNESIMCVVGESGSGKSVTSLSVMGLVPKPEGYIADGSITFKGQNLIDFTEKEISNIRGNEIAMIFQEPMTSLNPVLSIEVQMVEQLLRHKKISKKNALVKIKEMLEFIGFSRTEQILKSYPHELSGGMRQRVLIGMAMLCEPELLIADEPTTALDVTIQAQVLELMKQMKEKYSTSVMMITHDLGIVAEIADEVVVMYAGQIVEKASADDLFKEPLHPYTQALLKSIPKIGETTRELYSIPGTVPSADNFPKGCRFAERCEYAVESCHKKMPELREIKARHFVRCDLVEGGEPDNG